MHPNRDLVTFSNEVELTDLKDTSYQFLYEHSVPIASRQWTFVVVAPDDTFPMDGIVFVALGATMIFVACVCLALWVGSHESRQNKHP